MAVCAILNIAILVLLIIHITCEHRIAKRIFGVWHDLQEQNKKLEEQNELLRTIFCKQYEEVKKKYGIKSEVKE